MQLADRGATGENHPGCVPRCLPRAPLMWKIAAVQMDCRLGEKSANLDAIGARLHEAAGKGARLVIFPECALTGYCFDSKAEAWPHAEPVPGPSTDLLARHCRELGAWAVVGMLEARDVDD